MKSFKKLILMFIMLVSVISLPSINVFANDDFEIGVNNLNGTEENSAKIRDCLMHPEKGWKRYDDTNSLIKYEGQWGRGNSLYYATYYNNTNIGATKGGVCTFYAYTSKLRLMDIYYYNRTKNTIISIDGLEEICSANDINIDGTEAQLSTQIFYEKTNLEKTLHKICIRNEDEGGFVFVLDAIDIDSDGYLINGDTILNIEAEKQNIYLNENVTANVTIDNIKEIAAEDMIINYDSEKLEFLGAEEVPGIKVVKSNETQGQLRVILASQGKENIANDKKVLLKLNFKGIATGDALVAITKGKISDGIEMERDLAEEECGQATIIIEDYKDPSKDGSFTLLDLAIDGRHYGENPSDLPQYKTDVVENGTIDDSDLIKIGEYMLENSNYSFN